MVWLFVLLTAAMVLRAAGRQRHPLGSLAAGAVCGLAAVGAVNALARYTGVALPLNGVTLYAAGVLGLPGVVTLLVLRVLLGLP